MQIDRLHVVGMTWHCGIYDVKDESFNRVANRIASLHQVMLFLRVRMYGNEQLSFMNEIYIFSRLLRMFVRLIELIS